MKPLVTIVAPIMHRYDAISSAVWHTYQGLASRKDWNVAILTGSNEFDDVPARIVHGVGNLLTEPAFCNADVLIYHFGFHNPIFDVLPIVGRQTKQIVRFHNITPEEFVPEELKPRIKDSYRQVLNLHHVDRVWADSPFNAQVLDEYNINSDKVEVIPLAVDKPILWDLRAKQNERLELLFVGRVVQSKGVLDCIEAVSHLKRSGVAFSLSIVGNLTFADAGYLQRCKQRVAELGLEDEVKFLGTLNDAALADAFKRADIFVIPSYHEGFCVPIVESLRSGCIPVGYAAGNLPRITNGFGRLTLAGDIAGLAEALLQVSKGLDAAHQDPSQRCLQLDGGLISADEYDEKTKVYAREFTTSQVYATQVQRVRDLLSEQA